MRSKCLATIAFVLFSACQLKAAVVHVNGAVASSGDGSTWALAWKTVQEGLADANPGDEVCVAANTYTPGTLRTNSFQLPADVEVYGGFNGTETVFAERNFVVNVTILSGDIGILGDPGDNIYTIVK